MYVGDRKFTPENLYNVGLCEKDRDGTVVYQNAKCKELCGLRVGKVCNEGCMVRFHSEGFDLGFNPIRNVHQDQPAIEGIVLNDGNSLTTILFDSREHVDLLMRKLVAAGLTSAELAIARCVLQRLTNQEIAEKNFISTKTLRTHLNNIYKKLPVDLRRDFRSISHRKV